MLFSKKKKSKVVGCPLDEVVTRQAGAWEFPHLVELVLESLRSERKQSPTESTLSKLSTCRTQSRPPARIPSPPRPPLARYFLAGSSLRSGDKHAGLVSGGVKVL